MRAYVVIAVGVLGLWPYSAFSQEDSTCEKNPKVVECFDIRGRLDVDVHMLRRLWPIGSKHLYSLIGPSGETSLPKNIQKVYGVCTNVYANFRVCSFEPREEFGSVCIESASKIRTENVQNGTCDIIRASKKSDAESR